MNKMYTFLVLTYFVSSYYEVAARSSLRVVNGTDAEDGEFPYVVQIRAKSGTFRCGGSIIAPDWILTAAHCYPNDSDRIVYGFNQQSSSPNTTIKVKEHFSHPNFIHNKYGVGEYDIALLRLSKPIPLGAKATTIQLVAPDGDVAFHVETKYAGWGLTSINNDTAVPLQKITTQILTDEECTSIYNNASGVNIWDVKNNVCIENYSNGVCYGDSGSPLVVNGIQYGITSWVYKPCQMFPAAFVRISNPEYRKWIKEISNI